MERDLGGAMVEVESGRGTLRLYLREIMLALGVTALEALGLEVDVVTGNSSLWNYYLL